MQEVDRVIEAVFHYAKIIKEKGVQEYIFNEYKRVGEIEFEFADKKNAVSYNVGLAKKC